ncbi:glycosyltransferase [Streptomyces chrestomyceticus]|uniref:glycosyltransferase n=1 Tax=Streptomyces chrestomyceticus TaxID=68185 RepID=UPI00379FE27B
MCLPAADLQLLLAPPSEETQQIPEPSEPRPAELTVGICTYDDFDGAWFTIASLMLHHSHLMPRTEILLIDNHPEGPAAAPLKALDGKVGNLRYVPVTTVRSTAVRDMLFRLATGDIVVVLDSHVLLAPGALDAVLDHYTRRPDSRDLLQGPLLTDDGGTVSGTHLNPVWSDGMYGQWDVDPRGTAPDGEAFDIPMQGLGTFACRRDAWPGLNPRFRGFGGEEGYLHEKVRRHGGRTLCLPAFRWVHRFERPAGIPYAPTWQDKLRNNLLAWHELGWDTHQVVHHFAQHFDGDTIHAVRMDVHAELSHPLAVFDGVTRPAPPDTGDAADAGKVRFAGQTDEAPLTTAVIPSVAHASPEISRLLTHRRCLAFAHLHGWRSVLVADTAEALTRPCLQVGEPDQAARRGAPATPASRPDSRAEGQEPAAVGYHAAACTRLLDLLPATPSDAEQWIGRHGTLDAWLLRGDGPWGAVWVSLPRAPAAGHAEAVAPETVTPEAVVPD